MISARRPKLPSRAATGLTLRSPLPVMLDHADMFPDSKPSAKIRSGKGVFVAVGVFVIVGVCVEVAVKLAVEVAVAVWVGSLVGVDVSVAVGSGVEVFVGL